MNTLRTCCRWVVPLLLGLHGCRGETPATKSGSSVCSEWAPNVVTAWPSDTLTVPVEALPAGGIALSRSSVFVLDLAQGRVVRLDSTAHIIASFGRSGDGPGELARAHSTSIGYLTSPDWIAVRSESLFVFDGRSVHVLATDGTLLAQWSVGARAGAGVSTRLRMLRNGIVVDVHRGFDPSDRVRLIRPNRSFRLIRVLPESVTVLAHFPLPPAPITAEGTIFEGPAEARPLWDVVGQCIVVIDGSSPTLTLIDTESGARETRLLPLPERFVDVKQANANMPFEGMTVGPIPAPARPKRVSELTLDRAGWIWMRPTPPAPAPEAGIEVWRYHIPTGRFMFDTLPAFPRLLDASGRVVGVATDHSFVTRVIPMAR